MKDVDDNPPPPRPPDNQPLHLTAAACRFFETHSSPAAAAGERCRWAREDAGKGGNGYRQDG
jgi:hypothetical protein